MQNLPERREGMDLLVSINWIALFVLIIALLMFKLLNYLAYRINWTFVVLLAMVFGAILGVVFTTDDGAYLTWTNLIGDVYVNLITALVAPVVLVSVISGFISLNDREKMKNIGVKSVFWLLFSAAGAIVMSIFFGLVTGLGKNGGAIFADISSVSESTLSAYEDVKTSFDQILLALFPSNVLGDMVNDNIVAIIIIAVATAVAYVGIASEQGEEKVLPFKNLIDAVKEIIYRILSFIIDLTPYAVLCLTASSASELFSDMDALLQLLLLIAMIYLVCFLHAFGFNAILIKFVAKLSPVKFFKKIFQAQATGFTTQSSVGTLPVTINALTKRVGVDEEIANFTAPLGTTIGMPGCTCIWPVLLAIFYMNAMGLHWSVGDYLVLAFMALILSLGGAGIPGIGVVSAVALFSAVDLPIAAVVLLMPINSISDMARTMINVSTGNVAATIVARQTGLLNEEIFNAEEKGAKA
jgi:hypothetical protein